MKKVLLLVSLFLGFCSYSQKYYDENNLNSFLDYDNKTIDIKFEEYNIKGGFEKLSDKDYTDYLVLRGENNIHFIIKLYLKNIFSGIDVVEGEYDLVVKGLLKGRKYSKKVKLLFSNLPNLGKMEGLNLISKWERDDKIKTEKEKEIKKQKKEEFLGKFSESGLEGVYDIQILKSGNLDYSVVDTFGKLYLTEEGITIKTDIPSLDLVRSNYIFERCDVDRNSFIGNISKGYGDTLSLNLSFRNEIKVGGFSIIRGGSVRTTTFKIIDK